MYGSDAVGQVLVALAADDEAGVLDEAAELGLGGEALDALDEVLVGVAVAGDELADEGDGGEAPALVEGVEGGVADLAELEAGEDAAGLEHAVRLGQGGGDVGEVADAEGDGVQVERGRGDGGREPGGVGLEERERGLLRRGERLRPLLPDRQHRRVDVADGDVDVRVRVHDVRVVQHPEGDVARAAGDVENALRGRGHAGGEARVQRGDEVVPERGGGWLVSGLPAGTEGGGGGGREMDGRTSRYGATRRTSGRSCGRTIRPRCGRRPLRAPSSRTRRGRPGTRSVLSAGCRQSESCRGALMMSCWAEGLAHLYRSSAGSDVCGESGRYMSMLRVDVVLCVQLRAERDG